MWRFIESIFKFVIELMVNINHGLNKAHESLEALNEEMDKAHNDYLKKHSFAGNLDNAIRHAINSDTYIILSKEQMQEVLENYHLGLCYKDKNQQCYHWCITYYQNFYNIMVSGKLLSATQTKKFTTLDDFKKIDEFTEKLMRK